jgi:hypothetical protein
LCTYSIYAHSHGRFFSQGRLDTHDKEKVDCILLDGLMIRSNIIDFCYYSIRFTQHSMGHKHLFCGYRVKAIAIWMDTSQSAENECRFHLIGKY